MGESSPSSSGAGSSHRGASSTSSSDRQKRSNSKDSDGSSSSGLKHGRNGRRPTDGSFPACPKSSVCRAKSVRNHSACRNCALSDTSLQDYLVTAVGSSSTIFDKIRQRAPVCLDLLARTVDSVGGSQAEPDFEKVVLMLYHTYGHGNVADMYLGKALSAPRPGDSAHARMILEEMGLTCYAFNHDTDKCQYVEDLIYCKRHTPILSVPMLIRMCTKYERARRNKRKYPNAPTIVDIKNAILTHESQIKRMCKQNRSSPASYNCGDDGNGGEDTRKDADVSTKTLSSSTRKFKDIALRKRFNSWLRKVGSSDGGGRGV